MRNLFGFYFDITINLAKKQEMFFDFLKVFQTHKKKAREKI